MWHKSLAIKVKLLGHDHPNTAMTYGNIGLVYSLMGNSAKAIEYLQHDLEIKLKVYGDDHPLVAETKNKCVTDSCPAAESPLSFFPVSLIDCFRKPSCLICGAA